MAYWTNRLDISSAMKSAHAGKITIAECARQISDKATGRQLRGATLVQQSDFDDICNKFSDLSNDPNATADEFDDILEELYDLGDDDHLIWIDSFGKL